MRVDAHQHFWSTKRPNDYGFLTPAAGVLYKDYLPGQLEPHLIENKIDCTILVQAAESIEETEWLLGIAGHTSFVAGVVGWVDFDSTPTAFNAQLNVFKKNPKFIGVRPMLQDLDDDKFILRPRVIENLKTIAAMDFPFDLLIYPKHLPHVYEMLQLVPGLRAVIDHLAKPKIRDKQIDDWTLWMERIGAIPNVWCKLSGVVTEADHQLWKPADFYPYVKTAVKAFGGNRLMYGSDWPVCLQAANYTQVYQLLNKILNDLPGGIDAATHDAIFGKNAATFYKITPR